MSDSLSLSSNVALKCPDSPYEERGEMEERWERDGRDGSRMEREEVMKREEE